MQKLSFVIGATASGKTYFIHHYFAGEDVEILNMENRKRTDIWKEFQEKLKQDALTESDFTCPQSCRPSCGGIMCPCWNGRTGMTVIPFPGEGQERDQSPTMQ